MTRAHAHTHTHAVRRMCPDCEALNADRARVARDAGLVESAVLIDIKTRRVGSGQHFLFLGCATRWERQPGVGWHPLTSAR